MSKRTDRVDELLRREIANVIMRGELRDPRLGELAALSITAVRVTGDLSQARVFFDVLSADTDAQRVTSGLRACAGLIRTKVGAQLRMKRTPRLIFEYDESVRTGAKIETLLCELRENTVVAEVEPESAASGDELDAQGCSEAAAKVSKGEGGSTAPSQVTADRVSSPGGD